jgi:hypothetical protein
MTTSISGTDIPLSPAQRRDAAGDIPLPRNAPAHPSIHDTSSDATDDGAAPARGRYGSSDQRVPPSPQQQSARAAGGTSNQHGGVPTSTAAVPTRPSVAPVASSASAGPVMPTSSSTTPGTASGAHSALPFLSGVTPVELKGLLDAHETETLPNGVRSSRDNVQDEENMARLGKDLKRGLTGYPSKVQQFEDDVNDMQAQLSILPPSEHETYAGALATLDVAFRNSTDADTRQRAGQQLSLLGDALLKRVTPAYSDPVQQALGVFNQPVGAGYLSQADDQRNLNELTRLRDQFVAASTPASRQLYFTQAADLKNDLQHRIATAIDQHMKQEAGKWADANAEVDRIIHETEGVTGDPGKRYELIGRQLFSTHPGSGRDDFADRRLLAFTQRMQDDPALHDKLADWSVEAGRKLNGYGVDGQKDSRPHRGRRCGRFLRAAGR